MNTNLNNQVENNKKDELMFDALKAIVNGDLGSAREILNNSLKNEEEERKKEAAIEESRKNQENLHNKLDIIKEHIIANAVKEFDKFKEKMLKEKTCVVFDEAYKISSYVDLLYFFENDGMEQIVDEDDYITQFQLISFENMKNCNNLLEVLYETSLNMECITTQKWDDIQLIIEYKFFDK